MKRRISLVIALALSFLIMFGSIALAEEINAQIPLPPSEPTKLEVVKVSSAQTNQVDSPQPQAKVNSQVLPQTKQMKDDVHFRPASCTLECRDGRLGYWDVDGLRCIPC